MPITATIITRAMVTDIGVFDKDLGHDDRPVPGLQFFDVDDDGTPIDGPAPDPEIDGGPVLALLFSNPADRTIITSDMVVSWATITGAPDMADQFNDNDGGQGVYLDRDLFALLVQSN